MKPKPNDVVRLVGERPRESLPAGAIGTIVSVFSSPEEAYEIEFCDENGRTIAQVALRPEEFVVVSAN
jgi:hypothetical protein